jgi:hypothetical protein
MFEIEASTGKPPAGVRQCMDRPRVASRMSAMEGWSCASVSPLNGAFVPLATWISARTRSHSAKGPERPVGSPEPRCDCETVFQSSQSNSQTSVAGKSLIKLGSAGLNSCHARYHTCFVVAAFCQNSPSYPWQFVGECGCQNIVMQPFRCGREPAPLLSAPQSAVPAPSANGVCRSNRWRPIFGSWMSIFCLSMNEF